MRGKEERIKRELEARPRAVRKRDLHSSQEGTPVPVFGAKRKRNISLHDYRGALGMACMKKK